MFQNKIYIINYLALLDVCVILVSCFVYSSTLKKQATYSSEKSVGFQRTTLYYVPDNRALHDHCCENLKSYKKYRLLLFIAVNNKNVKMFSIPNRQLYNLRSDRV